MRDKIKTLKEMRDMLRYDKGYYDALGTAIRLMEDKLKCVKLKSQTETVVRIEPSEALLKAVRDVKKAIKKLEGLKPKKLNMEKFKHTSSMPEFRCGDWVIKP